MILPTDDLDPHCEHCGYSLRGLQSPRCSECGIIIDWHRVAELGGTSFDGVAIDARSTQLRLGAVWAGISVTPAPLVNQMSEAELRACALSILIGGLSLSIYFVRASLVRWIAIQRVQHGRLHLSETVVLVVASICTFAASFFAVGVLLSTLILVIKCAASM